MDDLETYWIELKNGEYITANWSNVTQRWSFNDNDDVLGSIGVRSVRLPMVESVAY
jgi:hypothetical protein